jgi:hypothetical protein
MVSVKTAHRIWRESPVQAIEPFDDFHIGQNKCKTAFRRQWWLIPCNRIMTRPVQADSGENVAAKEHRTAEIATWFVPAS